MVGQIFADMDDRIRESGLEFVTRLTEDSTELVSDNRTSTGSARI